MMWWATAGAPNNAGQAGTAYHVVRRGVGEGDLSGCRLGEERGGGSSPPIRTPVDEQETLVAQESVDLAKQRLLLSAPWVSTLTASIRSSKRVSTRTGLGATSSIWRQRERMSLAAPMAMSTTSGGEEYGTKAQAIADPTRRPRSVGARQPDVNVSVQRLDLACTRPRGAIR